VIMRVREPKSTALIFRTGKLICAGARSVPLALHACHVYTRIIQRVGFPLATASAFTVINLVATINTRFPIRLEQLAAEHEESCTYEPELFPGLVYRVEEPKCVVLIFVSGKCVVTGAKGMDEVKRAVEFIWPVLRLYSKGGVVGGPNIHVHT
jgi:transcription initiation factor TFIID TATA-box-binding protein